MVGNAGRQAPPPAAVPGVPVPPYQQYPTGHERQNETYVLADAANAAIPKDIRDRFPQDDQGRVLFFTRPPLDTRHIVTGRSANEKTQPLAHTQAYLEAKAARQELIAERKRVLQASIAQSNTATNGTSRHSPSPKRLKVGSFADETREADGRIRADPAKAADIQRDFTAAEQQRVQAVKAAALAKMQRGIAQATANDYRRRYGEENALRFFEEDVARQIERETRWKQDVAMRKAAEEGVGGNGGRVVLGKDLESGAEEEEDKIARDTRRMLSKNFWTGRYPDGTGRWEDDWDNRLPRPT
jgi:hypothetical protein